jgi:hypothetical protein
VYGFIRSPVDRDQRLRERQAHPAVALGLDHDERPGLRDREVRAGHPDRRGQELAAQVQAGRLRQGRRVVGEVERRVAHAVGEDLPDLVAVVVDRRHQDVGRLVVGELDDQLGEIGLGGDDAGPFQGRVELDLLGGHRFDLDDLAGVRLTGQADDDVAGLGGVPGPVHDGTGPGRGGLELGEQLRQAGHHAGLDGAAGQA